MPATIEAFVQTLPALQRDQTAAQSAGSTRASCIARLQAAARRTSQHGSHCRACTKPIKTS